MKYLPEIGVPCRYIHLRIGTGGGGLLLMWQWTFEFHKNVLTSLVVWWLELLTTNHEVPGSIPGTTMGIFPCRGRIPVVTMVWVVSRIRFKVETSLTRSHTWINSWLNPRQRSRWRGPHHERQPAHQLIEYLILWLLIMEEKKKFSAVESTSGHMVL